MEIKFRAWLKHEQKMVDVFGIDFQLRDGVIYYAEDDHDNNEQHMLIAEFKSIELMQYTGFKDMHRQGIYEGDLLGLKYPYDRRFKVEAKVVKGERIAAYCLIYKDGFTTEETPLYKLSAKNYLEIIGNIYENPELREGVEDGLKN